MSKIVDLSVPIGEGYPGHWPGNRPMSVERLGWYDQPDPYFNRWIQLEEHTGTHIDAPAHFIPAADLPFPKASPMGDGTVEKIPLEHLVVDACVIDVRDLVGTAPPGISPKIGVERIFAWEAGYGKIEDGGGVLLFSGWTDRFYKKGEAGRHHADTCVLDQSEPAWPGFDLDALDLLIDRGVALIGTDCPSGGPLDIIVEAHYKALGAGIPYVENLTNLGYLPPVGAQFIFLPLKIEGGSGAPGRAIAIIK